MQTSNTINPPSRTRRNSSKAKRTEEMTTIDSTEARLNTHEQICAERYKGIETRMTSIDDRFDKLEGDVKELKDSTGKSLSEIKNLLSGAKDEKFKVMITVTGTIIVSLIGMLGYILTHLK